MAANKIVGNIPLQEKLNLSIDEAAVYSGVGVNQIKKWMANPDCTFYFWLTRKKRLIRRKQFEEFLMSRNDFSELASDDKDD